MSPKSLEELAELKVQSLGSLEDLASQNPKTPKP